VLYKRENEVHTPLKKVLTGSCDNEPETRGEKVRGEKQRRGRREESSPKGTSKRKGNLGRHSARLRDKKGGGTGRQGERTCGWANRVDGTYEKKPHIMHGNESGGRQGDGTMSKGGVAALEKGGYLPGERGTLVAVLKTEQEGGEVKTSHTPLA